MRITKIRVQNLLGFETLEVTPGSALTVASGPNGTGKTSFIESVKAFFKGGSDVTIVRNGHDHGEVAVEFDDGYAGRRTWNAAGETAITVTGPDGKKIPSPQKFLTSLADAVTLNPLALLSAPPGKRVAWLIETVPVEVSAEELTAALGVPFRPNGEEKNGFDLISRLRKACYDDRTGINGQLTSKKKTIEELTLTLPEVDPDAAPLADLRARREAVVREQAVAEKAIAAKRAADEKAVATKAEEKRKGLRDVAEAEIQAIRTRLAVELGDVDRKMRAYVETLDTKERAALADVATAHASQLTTLAEEIGRAETLARQADQVATTRVAISRYAAEVEELARRSEEQTAALAGLDSLKEQLVSRVPIKGLEVRDGDIWIDGVQFDRLNEESKVRVACQLARLRAGDAPILCLDGLESLDKKHFAAFEKFVEKSGVQAFVTVVEDTAALKFTTTNSAAPAA